MIRFFLTATVVVFGLAVAQQNWVESIINPTPESRAAVCKDVFERTTANTFQVSEIRTYLTQSGASQFQSILGSVLSVCRAAARRLDNIPSLSVLMSTSVLLWVSGSVRELRSARDWAAVFVLYGQDGSEIARVRFNPRSSSLGNTDDWKADCSGSSCRWVGRNLYYFSINAEFLEKLKEATSFGFLYTDASGVNTVKFTQQEYPNLK
ncbi:MAG: hypothetical protein SFU83_11145 [Meiothermus sp.]|nr:hypothetical protein [Meiothermus sp.]